MANIRVLAIFGCFVTAASSAVAMPPQDIPAEVKSCKTIANDRERLKCFDDLFGSTPKPQASVEGKLGNWSSRAKSPTMAVSGGGGESRRRRCTHSSM